MAPAAVGCGAVVVTVLETCVVTGSALVVLEWAGVVIMVVVDVAVVAVT